MNELNLAAQPSLCKRCHALVREEDNYCSACGKSLKPGRGFLFTHTGIILMALVLGPFVLQFVWMSKVLGPLAKIIYTVVLVLLGFYLVYSLFHVFTLVAQSMQLLVGDISGLEKGFSQLQNMGSF